MQLPNTENSTIADAEECVTEHIAIDVAKKCKKKACYDKNRIPLFCFIFKTNKNEDIRF